MLKRMRQKRTDLAKILSRIRKLLSVARTRGKIKEQKREEQRRAWKGTVSRLQDKENDKDTESVQTRLIIFVGRRATYDVYVSPRRDAPVRLIATGTPKTNYFIAVLQTWEIPPLLPLFFFFCFHLKKFVRYN